MFEDLACLQKHETLPLIPALLAADIIIACRYEGDVEDLGLDFTVDDETFGQVQCMLLHPLRHTQSVQHPADLESLSSCILCTKVNMRDSPVAQPTSELLTLS